ncbi:MAG: SDR family oxidoreductase [Sphingobacteriales bacterium]|nr:MAG: SDR family oxidoreductase [Sphingobacteriales bacterium]
MMRFLIIGASGLVGGNALRYLKEQNDVEVLGTHFSFATPETHFFDTLNLHNPENFPIADFKPTHILHAGALTHVDYCEEHPEESYRQTVQSTINVLALAKAFSAKVIYVSTDYVFDGNSGPYDEEALPNPINVYGKHKLEAELLIQRDSHEHLILRITNVYGDEIRGKNFVSRLIEFAKSGEKVELKLPYDQYATPVNALDVAKAFFQLCIYGKNGIYHIASTDYMNRVQLTKEIFKFAGNKSIVMKPIFTKDLLQPAKRPLQGGLKSAKFIAQFVDFEYDSISGYLNVKFNQLKGK